MYVETVYYIINTKIGITDCDIQQYNVQGSHWWLYSLNHLKGMKHCHDQEVMGLGSG